MIMAKQQKQKQPWHSNFVGLKINRLMASRKRRSRSRSCRLPPPQFAQLTIGYTFLPCVLAGLSNAPQYSVADPGVVEKACIYADDVDSVILPIDACAGDGAFAFARKKRNKVNVSNYWEAIGVVAAHKAGINPNSLRKNRITNIPCRSSLSPNGSAFSRAWSFSDPPTLFPRL